MGVLHVGVGRYGSTTCGRRKVGEYYLSVEVSRGVLPVEVGR